MQKYCGTGTTSLREAITPSVTDSRVAGVPHPQSFLNTSCSICLSSVRPPRSCFSCKFSKNYFNRQPLNSLDLFGVSSSFFKSASQCPYCELQLTLEAR